MSDGPTKPPKMVPVSEHNRSGDRRSVVTERDQLFVLEYVSDPEHNGAAAAVRAGYSEKTAKHTAYRLLQRPAIKKLIKEHDEPGSDKDGVTTELVVGGILESIETAQAAGAGAWQMAAIQRGWELLGRYLGIFTDKVEVGLDERLMAQLNAGRRRAAGIEEPEDDTERDAAGWEPSAAQPAKLKGTISEARRKPS